MSSKCRIAISLFGPPLLVSGLFTAIGWAFDSEIALTDTPIMFLWCLAMACLFGGIPTIVFVAIMESAYERGIEPASRDAMILSTVTGGIMGFACSVVASMGNFSETEFRTMFYLSLIGAVIGLTIAAIIRAWSGHDVDGNT